jgi:hypothetical protein
LLASVRAFSAFFTLASADLVDFSALTLAAVVASKLFGKRRVQLSATKCEHWLSLEHLQFTKEERKSQAKSKERHTRQTNIGKEIYPQRP